MNEMTYLIECLICKRDQPYPVQILFESAEEREIWADRQLDETTAN